MKIAIMVLFFILLTYYVFLLIRYRSVRRGSINFFKSIWRKLSSLKRIDKFMWGAKTMDEMNKLWDKGEFCFPDNVQEKLGFLSVGQKIGSIINDCTICEVRNATCHHFIEASLYLFHPKLGGKEKIIWICALGKDSRNCVLNKWEKS